jgi:hypothetical protein
LLIAHGASDRFILNRYHTINLLLEDDAIAYVASVHPVHNEALLVGEAVLTDEILPRHIPTMIAE